ncbi:MAG TPA: low affinity iron permease family protein [Sphingomicrobium sp.]|nr:low affinity iron permease family protein [Sphingomicrobium sp.]
MNQVFERISGNVAAAAGKSSVFMVALAVIILWALTGPVFQWSNTWQLAINTGTTIVTFLMVFLIQNAQNRDASAIQAKLDELIRAGGRSRNEFIGVEHLSEEELLALRGVLEKVAGDEVTHHRAIERLIARR